jgi:hypothetical protein
MLHCYHVPSRQSSLNFSSDVIKTGSADAKIKTETDCTEAEAEAKTGSLGRAETETRTDMPEIKTETETNCAETGRDQKYTLFKAGQTQSALSLLSEDLEPLHKNYAWNN